MKSFSGVCFFGEKIGPKNLKKKDVGSISLCGHLTGFDNVKKMQIIFINDVTTIEAVNN
jgi:hypothetical protein